MKIIIIGSGTGVPSLKRASPALMVVVAKEHLLFDTGPGTLRQMQHLGYDYRTPDYIFYTHFHVDHIADLAAFLFAAKYPSSPRRKPLVLVGPEGFKDFYRRLLDLYGDQLLSDLYELKIREIKEMPIIKRNWKITARHLPHTESSLGYRLEDEEGKVVVYSGDTDYAPELIELAKEADLLILESSFPDEIKVGGHLTPRLAGRAAREANCKRLLLTHFYPECDRVDILSQCCQEYDGEIILALDMLRVEI
ncbi:MBL fold metallo-hydrolase [bacterium]|nr:MBL fold metallo-hydrolase [bacterium]